MRPRKSAQSRLLLAGDCPFLANTHFANVGRCHQAGNYNAIIIDGRTLSRQLVGCPKRVKTRRSQSCPTAQFVRCRSRASTPLWLAAATSAPTRRFVSLAIRHYARFLEARYELEKANRKFAAASSGKFGRTQPDSSTRTAAGRACGCASASRKKRRAMALRSKLNRMFANTCASNVSAARSMSVPP